MLTRWKLSDILIEKYDCYHDWEGIVFEEQEVKDKFIETIKEAYKIYGTSEDINIKSAICDMCLMFSLEYLKEVHINNINIEKMIDYTMYLVVNIFECNQITKSGVEW